MEQVNSECGPSTSCQISGTIVVACQCTTIMQILECEGIESCALH